jgi:archaellum biogenesis ATPase FlaH
LESKKVFNVKLSNFLINAIILQILLLHFKEFTEMINVEQLSPKSFFKVFKGRTDRVMLYARGKEITQEIKRGEFEIIQRLEAHLAGSTRVGFYNMLNSNDVSWAVVNFTKGGASENPARDSRIFAVELRKLGLRGVRRERTMLPDEDYSVWIFFETPIQAKKVRYLIFLLFEKLGFSKNIPIIPTTDTLNPGSFGQHVWVPYFNGIDKWLDDEGNMYVCKGIKDQQAVFIDNDEKVIENNIFDVPASGEGEIDQAITVLSGDTAKKYLPGIGLFIPKGAFYGMLKNCTAFQNVVNKIEQTGDVSQEGLLRLSALLRGVGLDKLFDKYAEKLPNLEKSKFEKSFAAYNGQVFPTCLEMKQIGFCPIEKNCFEKRAVIKEKMGIWAEAAGSEKNIEPTNAQWFYKAILEHEGEEADSESVATSVETSPLAVSQVNLNTPIFREQPVKISLQSTGKFFDDFEEKVSKLKSGFDLDKKKLPGFSTGFDNLDETLGGLRKGNLLVLSGSPGSGKTSLSKQVMDAVLEKEKVTCLYVSYDLSAENLHMKTISRLSGVPVVSILKGELNEDTMGKIVKVSRMLKERTGNLLFTLEADDSVSVSGIKKAIEDTNAGFVVIDHIQAMPDGESAGPDPETRRLALLNRLKHLARSFNIPILAISNGVTSRSIQYGSDVVLQVQHQVNPQIASSDKQPYAVLLNVEKNREGKSLVSLQLTFFPPRMMFYNEKPIEYRPIKY